MVTYGIKLLSCLFVSFGWSRSFLFKDLIFCMLSSIRAAGYFCFKRNVCSSSNLVSSVFLLL